MSNNFTCDCSCHMNDRAFLVGSFCNVCRGLVGENFKNIAIAHYEAIATENARLLLKIEELKTNFNNQMTRDFYNTANYEAVATENKRLKENNAEIRHKLAVAKDIEDGLRKKWQEETDRASKLSDEKKELKKENEKLKKAQVENCQLRRKIDELEARLRECINPKFKVGDRVMVYPNYPHESGKFKGVITNITPDYKLSVTEDGFISPHDNAPYSPQACKKLKPKKKEFKVGDRVMATSIDGRKIKGKIINDDFFFGELRYRIHFDNDRDGLFDAEHLKKLVKVKKRKKKEFKVGDRVRAYPLDDLSFKATVISVDADLDNIYLLRDDSALIRLKYRLFGSNRLRKLVKTKFKDGDRVIVEVDGEDFIGTIVNGDYHFIEFDDGEIGFFGTKRIRRLQKVK